MNTVLVTGGAGFIGANYVEYLLDLQQGYRILVLDKLTYAGSLKNLERVWDNPNFTFVEGDIADEDLLVTLFEKYVITDVIHFAAESHVDNSIRSEERRVGKI